MKDESQYAGKEIWTCAGESQYAGKEIWSCAGKFKWVVGIKSTLQVKLVRYSNLHWVSCNSSGLSNHKKKNLAFFFSVQMPLGSLCC